MPTDHGGNSGSDAGAVSRLLRDQGRQFQLLAERVDQVFWMSTPGIQEMLYISPAYEHIWARSCASLYEHPQSFLDAVHPDDRERVAAGVESHANGEWEHEYRIVQPDGEVRFIRDRGTGLHDEEGQLVGMCGTCVDLTDLKVIEGELRSTVRALARARRDLEQFAYAAADDMQVPLRQLREGLRAAQADPDSGGGLARADLNAPLDRLERMLGDVMEYVGLTDSPDPPLPRDLGQCARLALSGLAAAIETRGAQIHLDALPTVPADGPQMVRLFQLLVSNALEHGAGGAPVIWVDAERGDDGWVIRVRDQGPGIDPPDHEALFRMFTSRGNSPGTGAGLAIARRIVELHGGRIWVESEPGQGTTFLFALPEQPVQMAGWTG
jgi:PAS domain S-box-containing protein